MLMHYFPIKNIHEKTRLHCGQALCRCFWELANCDEQHSTIRLTRAARQHLLLYAALSQTAESDRFWHIYPKHHLFVHVAEDQSKPCTALELR